MRGQFFNHDPCDGVTHDTAVAPWWANGRPAVVMRNELPDGTSKPHGVMVFEVDGGVITGLDAFIDAGVVELFEGE